MFPRPFKLRCLISKSKTQLKLKPLRDGNQATGTGLNTGMTHHNVLRSTKSRKWTLITTKFNNDCGIRLVFEGRVVSFGGPAMNCLGNIPLHFSPSPASCLLCRFFPSAFPPLILVFFIPLLILSPFSCFSCLSSLRQVWHLDSLRI